MADVGGDAPGAARNAAALTGDDRAQLVLVAALAMATLFVVLALLVNTTIYTGNVATRSDVSESATVVNYRSEAVEAAGQTVRYVTRHDNDSNGGGVDAYPAMSASLRRGVANWSDAAAAHAALSGTATETRVVSVTNGTRIAQTDGSRNLSGPSEASTWTPAVDVTGVRGPVMRLKSSSLASTSDGDDPGQLVDDDAFRVNLSEAGGDRSLFVWRNATDVGVTVRDPGGTVETCHASDDGTLTLDAHAATFEGEACPALRSFAATGGSFDVTFVRADRAVGTYSLVVDRESDSSAIGLPSSHRDGGAPFYTAALYAADVTVTYRSPDTYYDDTVEVPADA